MRTLLFPSGSSANPTPARAPARVVRVGGWVGVWVDGWVGGDHLGPSIFNFFQVCYQETCVHSKGGLKSCIRHLDKKL